MGSPYPLSFTLRWPYYLLQPSMRRRGFPRRWPLAHAFGGNDASPVVRVLFFGDLMPGPGGAVPDVHPELQALGRSADLVVLNCEGAVAEATHWKGLRLYLGEDYVVRWLEALGTTPERSVLSVANNHAGDAGADGFAETVRRLEGLGARPVGSVEHPAVTVTSGSLSLGVAAWTVWQNRPLARVAAAPPAVDADFVVGFPHWEAEFRHFPRASTRGAAHALLDDGFDLVVGAHPHVVQPIEWRGEGLCAYSLGNLSLHPLPRVRWPLRVGAALEVTVRADGPRKGRIASYRLHPLLHERDGATSRLVPLHATSPALRKRVERRMDLLFSPVNPDGGAP